MKGHKMKKADGGTVEENKEIEDKKSEFKRGGKAKHKKHGGKVEGKKPHGRADKFKRGGGVKCAKGGKVMSAGGMSASSPLSGAGKTAEPKAPVRDKEDD